MYQDCGRRIGKRGRKNGVGRGKIYSLNERRILIMYCTILCMQIESRESVTQSMYTYFLWTPFCVVSELIHSLAPSFVRFHCVSYFVRQAVERQERQKERKKVEESVAVRDPAVHVLDFRISGIQEFIS